MPRTKKPKSIRLPRLKLTTVVETETEGATRVCIPATKERRAVEYFIVPAIQLSTEVVPTVGRGTRSGTRPAAAVPAIERKGFNLFPIVLDSQGVPWAEAIVYLLNRMQEQQFPNMETLYAVAVDLSAFREFLDKKGIDWLYFPENKYERPTYRFDGALTFDSRTNEIELSTAKVRMSSVIGFYRWLIDNEVFKPEFAPWVDKDKFVQVVNKYGESRTKKVKSTDLHRTAPKQDDPYGGFIDDGGKLRPLPEQELEWIRDGLKATGTTELKLIFAIALLTGARIQTVLTFRFWHVTLDESQLDSSSVRIPVGPGTGIDTKGDKSDITLHMPRWLYEKLRVYAWSDVAKKRRSRAQGGDHADQYLFLSQQGSPFYRSKDDAATFDEDSTARYQLIGQAVRTYMHEKLIPYIRKKQNEPQFSFRFHDLRATFGMELTDFQQTLVSAGKIKPSQARNYVRVRMGHSDFATTERYFQHRSRQEQVRAVSEEHFEHQRRLMAPFL